MRANVTYQVSFRIVTFLTEYKFTDESIKQVLKFIGSVWSIHDIAIILIVRLGLGTKLAAKVFRRICNVMTAHNVHTCRHHDCKMAKGNCAQKKQTHTRLLLSGTTRLFRKDCKISTSQMTQNQLKALHKNCKFNYNFYKDANRTVTYSYPFCVQISSIKILLTISGNGRHTSWRSWESLCNFRHIGNYCLDSITFPLDLHRHSFHHVSTSYYLIPSITWIILDDNRFSST